MTELNFIDSGMERLKGKAILGVCASGVAAEARFAVDPDYKQRLEAAGVIVNQAYYEQLSGELLAQHDMVYLVGFPKTDSPDYVRLIENEKKPLLRAFVEQGGGLLVFVDDHYGRLFEPLNRFLADFNAEVLCEPLFEKNSVNNGKLPTSPEIATLRTTALNFRHPVLDGVREIVVPNAWQAGVWPLRLDAEWEVLASGEATVESRILWQEEVATFRQSPPFCAARRVGAGRLAIFSAHSTFFLGNGMHRRWDGHFFSEAQNDRFIVNLLTWLSEESMRKRASSSLTLIDENQTMDWFTSVPADKQPMTWPVHKGLVGLRSSLSGGSHSVAELCRAAREAGFAWVVFAEREEELPDANWPRLVAECEAESSDTFSALPGVDFLARNDFDNRGIVILPRFWPRRLENRRFIIQMIEEGGGFLVFSQPSAAHIPAWNNGGFQGMEIITYSGDGEVIGEAFGLYEKLQAHDWFLAPIARYHVTTPEQIAALASRTGLFHTYAAAPSPGKVRDSLPKIEGMEYQELFVSSGPLIEQFWMEGPGMIKDIWEGRYYVWSLSPEEVMTIHSRVSGPSPIEELQVWDDDKVCAAQHPHQTEVEFALPRANDRRCRSYRLVVRDGEGGAAWSTARRVRGSRFQAHGGGDRMNTYGSHYFPHPRGEFTLLGERCSASATMLFGLGWRQHQLNIYPPMATVDFHPEGGEWGAPAGRVERVHLNPIIHTTEGTEIERPLESRLGFDFASHEAAVLQDGVDHFEDVNYASTLDGYIPYARPHLEKCSPGVARYGEARLINAEMTYRFGRWRPEGGPVVMRMDVKITAKRDLEIAPCDGLSLRVLAMETDLDRFVSQLHFLAAESVHTSIDYPGAFTLCPLGEKGYVAASEQPYGSFGVYQLEGAPFTARAGKVSGHCELEVGWQLTSGARFPKGHSWAASLLLVIPGTPRGGDYFHRLHEALADGDSRWTFTRGTRADTGAYPVRVAVKDYAVAFKRAVSPVLNECGVGELLEISGLQDNWSVLAFDRQRGGRPLGCARGVAYWTLPDFDLEAVVGHPVISECEELRIQVVPKDGGLQIWTHNPTSHLVESGIRNNPAFPALSYFLQTFSLFPGASQETFIPLH
ncbi:MAG: hypothetical protein BGO12_12435 [Verrucomicrobia bacterium 61-8]|nr:MAG: hypothetical protein BGO12_12435 [Verrucomicrobia bacterium 61-8]